MMRKLLAVLIAAAVACAGTARCEDAPNYNHPPYQHPFEATLRAAEHGDVAAQVQVGRDYEKALGVEQDLERAIDWYKEAANAGSPQAMLALGLLFQDRNLPPQYKEKPEPWLLRAAQAGLPTAQVAEARFHSTSDASERQEIQTEWLERAVAQGDLEAMSVLGPMLASSDDPNQRSRGEEYVSAAESAYPRARFLFEMAKFLRDHKTSELTSAQMPDRLRLATLKIDVEEIREVGSPLLMLAGLLAVISGSNNFEDPGLRDGSLLRDRWEAAARAGDMQSACNLAFAKLGQVSQDKSQEHYREAFAWYLSAAKRGAPRAQYHLGKLYRDGLGTDANAPEAAKWFYQAALHDYLPAEAGLGDLLLRGNGVPTDYDAALGWLRPAAAYGNPMAQFDLGLMYQSGLGVQPDERRAMALIAAAATATELGDFVGRQGWPPALDWVKRAQADPALSDQIAKALARAPRPARDVDSAEGGCDEQSINSKIEE